MLRRTIVAIVCAIAAAVPAAARSYAAAGNTEHVDTSIQASQPGHSVTPLNAAGYQPFGSACTTIAGVRICWPGGVLGHTIIGSGRKMTDEQSSVEDLLGAGVVGGVYCNWRIDFNYYDTGNHLYRSRPGTQHSACTAISDPIIGQRQAGDITLQHDGKACAQFGANGRVYAKQCHNITG
jgi:hypothetical protein